MTIEEKKDHNKIDAEASGDNAAVNRSASEAAAEAAGQPEKGAVAQDEATEAAVDGDDISLSEEERQAAAAEEFGRFISEVAKTREELDKAKQELQDWENRYLRLQADFDNFRRRTRQEKEELGTYANEGLVKKLLPVLDNFQRALAAMEKAGAAENLLSGVAMIERQFTDILTKEGLQAMEAVGADFDPQSHEAVMFGEADERFADGMIMEELQKGYLFKSKVLRPAMVKVAKGG
ncbi:nucleotide exchange factor GrpE [Heliobacterium gestii]|uniref:Protein GrpE n=1 Tax=Heliomicrobium gestii TaxID=2699 RepID=A0A845LFT3_HELGE|nr:nucleotide exchange factor GrpE [Heliomicrobium gestii]MBM7868008.1 molecular chaperone GrpE [Heliomicrobium gestii]MZP44274.1 nucleotide exchange factor GrpE [Heliomicrobium gestii]